MKLSPESCQLRKQKNSAMRKVPGFTKQSADYQMVMTELNIADDYFKAVEWGGGMERQKNDMEKETYSLKHELVSTQMKLEAVLKDLEERQRELDRLNRRTAQLERELKEGQDKAFQNLRNNPSAARKIMPIVQAVEEIKNGGEVEAGIRLNASRTEYVPVSGARESSSRRPDPGRRNTGSRRIAQQPDTPAVSLHRSSRLRRCKGVKPGVRSRQGNDGSFRSGSGNRGTTCCACCGTHCGGALGMADEKWPNSNSAGADKAGFPTKVEEDKKITRGDVSWGYVRHLFFQETVQESWTKWKKTGGDTGAGRFIDSMKAAVAAGADAVYMGGSRFGARAYADNPDEKGLLEAIDYVHLHGRRLYMTVNTLFKGMS